MSAIRSFLASLGFITRIPMPYSWIYNKPFNEKGLYDWLPIAGLAIGLIQALVAILLLLSGMPAWLAVSLWLAVSAVLTGVFHEDGLADVADSLGSMDRSKRLEILKDSRLGTYGTSALILLYLIRFSAYTQLHAAGWLWPLFIVLVAAWMRWLPIWLMWRPGPAGGREGSLGSLYHPPRLWLLSAQGIVLLAASYLLGLPGVFWFIPLLFLLALLLGSCFRRWHGGTIGDGLGAAAVLTEVCLLAIVCTAWM
ncbi:MAG: adenosylcobinamide-GDP ribazoletransferase [Opitutales bacterium]|nr:adenosylcobinamide-GDP ribazoletransferase [Opitutales bacterium]